MRGLTLLTPKLTIELSIIREGAWKIYGTPELGEFLEQIPPNLQKDKLAILALLDRIAKDSTGPRLLPDDISHSVDEKHAIWEFIQGRLRILWFYDKNCIVVCACGFIKKTPRTPSSEKDQAIAIKKKYFESINPASPKHNRKGKKS